MTSRWPFTSGSPSAEVIEPRQRAHRHAVAARDAAQRFTRAYAVDDLMLPAAAVSVSGRSTRAAASSTLSGNCPLISGILQRLTGGDACRP